MDNERYCKQERFDCTFCNERGGCGLLYTTKHNKPCPFYVSKEQYEAERTEISRYIHDRRKVGSDNANLRLAEIRAGFGNPNRT